MSLALLCTGQGNQHPDMFRLTAEAEQASPLFKHATQLLGADPRLPDFWRDAEFSRSNRAAQVLCTLQGLAAHAALRPYLPSRLCVAGYSVGELTAWGVAGAIPPLAVLDFAATRAELMDAARGSASQGMVSIRGLCEDVVRGLCAERAADIAIANPDLSWVIAGASTDIANIATAAAAAGASKVTPIPVLVASHTFLMASAATAFESYLTDALVPARILSGVRLLSGVDGRAVFDVNDGIQKLAAQISHTVRWDLCLQSCVEAGVTACLELGPGQALAATAANAHPRMRAHGLDAFTTLQGAADWIAKYVEPRPQ